MSRASGLTLVVESLVVPLLVAGHWSCGGEVSDSAKTAPSDKGGVGGRAVSSTGGALLTSGGVAAGSGGTTSSASGGAATSAGQGSVSSLGGVAGAGGTAVAGTINGAGAPGAFVPCACGESECGLCPSDKSVRIEAGEQSYRIDSTEVTNLDYATFLATNPSTLGQPLSCSWNGSFVPPNNWPATGQESLPVAWVDWCDAYA